MEIDNIRNVRRVGDKTFLNKNEVNAMAILEYLPPYSPDCNPIEMAFAKLKALLRKAAARTVDDLWDAIADAIDAFTSTECENYFAAAGYDRD